MSINRNSELIVRYDGSKTSFESANGPKNTYIEAKVSKVVFITGSTATNATAEQKRQYIWITDGSSDKYIDMSNVEDIQNSLTHIAGLATNGSFVNIGDGRSGLNFVGANGVNVSQVINRVLDSNGVPYWTIKIDGSPITAAIQDKADLENGKIPTGQLPDYILGQLLFGGTAEFGTEDTLGISPSGNYKQMHNVPGSQERVTIDKDAFDDHEGEYFIAAAGFTAFGIPVNTGDWIVSTGVDWRKIDNTDAITKVAGVVPEDGDIPKAGLITALGVDKKYEKPSNGIPKSDLEQEVRTSLDKIDGIDNKVDQTTYKDKVAELEKSIESKYTKPSRGIPAADLADEVATAEKVNAAISAAVKGVENKIAAVDVKLEEKANTEDVYTKADPSSPPSDEAILVYDATNDTIKDSNYKISTDAQDLDHADQSRIPTCAQVYKFVADEIENSNIGDLEDRVVNGKSWIKTTSIQLVAGYMSDESKSYALPSAIDQSLEYVDDIIATNSYVDSKFYIIPEVTIYGINNAIDSGETESVVISVDQYKQLYDAVESGKQINIIIEDELPGLAPVSAYIEDCIYVEFVYNGCAYEVDFADDGSIMIYRDKLIHTSDIEELMPLPLIKPNKDAILIFDEVNNTVKDSGLAISMTAEDIWHASPDHVPTCAQVEEFVIESINNLQIGSSSNVYVIPDVAISNIDKHIETGKSSITGIDRDKYDEFCAAVAAGKQIYITIEEGFDGLTPVSAFVDDFIYVDFVYNGFAYKVDFEGEYYVTFSRAEISISGVVYIADFTISDLTNSSDTPIDYVSLKKAFDGNKTIIVPNRGLSYCVVSSISKVPAIGRDPERLVLNINAGTNLYTVSAFGGSVSSLKGSTKIVKKLVTEDVIGDINTALETIIAG